MINKETLNFFFFCLIISITAIIFLLVTGEKVYGLTIDEVCNPILNLSPSDCNEYWNLLTKNHSQTIIQENYNVNTSEILETLLSDYVSKDEFNELDEEVREDILNEFEKEFLKLSHRLEIETLNVTQRVVEKTEPKSLTETYSELLLLQEQKRLFEEFGDGDKKQEEEPKTQDIDVLRQDIQRLIENSILPQIRALENKVEDKQEVTQDTQTVRSCTVDAQCEPSQICTAGKCYADTRNKSQKFFDEVWFIFPNGTLIGLYLFLIFIKRIPDEYNVFKGFKKQEEEIERQQYYSETQPTGGQIKSMDSSNPDEQKQDRKDPYSVQ